MVGDMLVSKSTAVKWKNGDTNGGFGTGLNGKKGSAFSPHEPLNDAQLRASGNGRGGRKSKRDRKKKISSESVVPVAGKAVEMGLTRDECTSGPGTPEAVVGKHHPLLEGISSLINGYHRHKVMPPIPVQQLGDIAQYMYLTWLVDKYPKDTAAKIELDAYSPLYTSAIITLKGDFASQGTAQKEFLFEVRKKAMKAAVRLISMRTELEAQLKIIDGIKATKLAEFGREREACSKWVGEYYAAKKQFLTEWIAKKATPIEEYLKKFGLPAGGALAIAGAAFKKTVVDITEHIPLLSGVAPELIGLGIIGLWVLARVGRKLLELHLGTLKNHLPKSEERKKEREMARIASAQADVEQELEAKAFHLRNAFEEDRKGVIGELKDKYWAMLASGKYEVAA
ncbi:Uncharacterised protein [uncultured archaeon]|nr:Uncharacterised protein [uncultured archaeon]